MKINTIVSAFTTVLLGVTSCWAVSSGSLKTNSIVVAAGKESPWQHSYKNILATLSKDSSEEDIQGMIAYFKRNAIVIDLSEVNYNENEEIIGIRIVMHKDGQQANYAMASNKPIEPLELGYKNGVLFVREKNSVPSNHPLSGVFEQLKNGNFNGESLFTEDGFSLDFDNSAFRELLREGFGDMLQSFNNLLQSPEQRQQYNKNHSSPKSPTQPEKQTPKKESVAPKKATTPVKKQSILPKYNFSDKYGIEKLVVIDGKTQTFENLDRLAKADRLQEVDFLKPATAISIYGQEAKYGAIIATTKQ